MCLREGKVVPDRHWECRVNDRVIWTFLDERMMAYPCEVKTSDWSIECEGCLLLRRPHSSASFGYHPPILDCARHSILEAGSYLDLAARTLVDRDRGVAV